MVLARGAMDRAHVGEGRIGRVRYRFSGPGGARRLRAYWVSLEKSFETLAATAPGLASEMFPANVYKQVGCGLGGVEPTGGVSQGPWPAQCRARATLVARSHPLDIPWRRSACWLPAACLLVACWLPHKEQDSLGANTCCQVPPRPEPGAPPLTEPPPRPPPRPHPPPQVMQHASWRSEDGLRPLQQLKLRAKLEGVAVEHMDVALADRLGSELGIKRELVCDGERGGGPAWRRGCARELLVVGCPPALAVGAPVATRLPAPLIVARLPTPNPPPPATLAHAPAAAPDHEAVLRAPLRGQQGPQEARPARIARRVTRAAERASQAARPQHKVGGGEVAVPHTGSGSAS